MNKSEKLCDATYSVLAHAYHSCPHCGHLVMEHKNVDWTGVGAYTLKNHLPLEAGGYVAGQGFIQDK